MVPHSRFQTGRARMDFFAVDLLQNAIRLNARIIIGYERAMGLELPSQIDKHL